MSRVAWHLPPAVGIILENLETMLSLIALSAAAAAVDPACSLNGAMMAGKCACRKPWAGEDCGLLVFKKRPRSQLPAYGFSPNVTS